MIRSLTGRRVELMNKKWIAGSALVVAAFFAGCDKPPTADTREADAKAIRAVEVAWAKDAASKNVATFIKYYTADALVLMSGAPPMRGTQAITGGLKGAMADPNFSITFETTKVTVAKSGDLAYTEGTFSQTVTQAASKKKITEKGTYVTCWVKQADGGWKAATDFAMTEPPPPPPAAKQPAAAKKKKKK